MQMPTQPQATVRQSESAYAKFVTKSFFVLNNSVKKHKQNDFIKNFKLPIRKKAKNYAAYHKRSNLYFI